MPVDTENPGFGTLLKLMQENLHNVVDIMTVMQSAIRKQTEISTALLERVKILEWDSKETRQILAAEAENVRIAEAGEANLRSQIEDDRRREELEHDRQTSRST